MQNHLSNVATSQHKAAKQCTQITAAVGLAALFTFINLASAQQPGGIAASADLTKLVSASIGPYDSGCGCNFGASIYISSDSGATWTRTSSPTNSWVAVASSADGKNLVAAGAPGHWISYNSFLGFIYTSHDSGVTWIQTSAPINSWRGLASSADGVRLIAAAAPYSWYVTTYSGGLYVSTNSGATWIKTGAPTNEWSAVASSASGNVLLAASSFEGGDGLIYVSTNSGATWTETGAPINGWSSIILSADGVNAAAGDFYGTGMIYISTNSGAIWTESGAPALGWASVVCSANGKTLAAVADGYYQGDQIYASIDAGLTWFDTGTAAGFVACSADGAKLHPGGDLFISPPPPSLTIAPVSGDAIISWLVPSTGFVLQQNSDLNSTNWSNVLTSPMLNFTNLNYQVTIPLPLDCGFYRLKQQ